MDLIIKRKNALNESKKAKSGKTRSLGNTQYQFPWRFYQSKISLKLLKRIKLENLDMTSYKEMKRQTDIFVEQIGK